MSNRKDGSITVEAVLIVPIVLLAVFFLIYLAFYLHDMARIEGTMDKALMKASYVFKHDADFTTGEPYYETINDRGVFYMLFGNTQQEKKELEKYVKEQLAAGLFIVKVSGIKAEVDKRNIALRVETSLTITNKGVMNLFKQYTKKILVRKSTAHDPAETIRLTEVILDTGDKIKGVDALKSKIEQFLNKEE